MKLYNTLSRQIEEIKPINNGQIRLYTCGPTVYDYMHIGNLRKFVFDDTLRRTLEQTGLEVKHVMNITDVGHLTSDADEGEDKLEKGAEREGKTVWQVAEFYTQAFINDVTQMNIWPPNAYRSKNDTYARATDFIEPQIELINLLIDKDFAYKTEQAIYFDVTKLPSYGELTGQNLADKEIAVREAVVTDDNKRNPQDFAVWFFNVGRYKDHSMHWPSPWGEGFPGWHLECSAIIHATLSDPIDIHTGGVDNIGTHHVNEMAQTEAAYGHKLANYWIHSEHLLVDGHKMAKSLNNFYRLKDVVEKGYQPLALRVLFLQTHYRSQLNFTWDSLAAAQTYLSRLRAWADMKFQTNTYSNNDLKLSYKKALSDISELFADDLNSPQAMAVLSGLVSATEEQGIEPKAFEVLLKELDELLGLELSQRQNIDADIKILIDRRQSARETKDFAAADELRLKLLKQGIEIKDSQHGSIWSRTK